MPRGYILGHSVLVAGNVDANCLHTCIRQRFPNWGVTPYSFLHPLMNLSRYLACRLIMETTHLTKYAEHYHPRL